MGIGKIVKTTQVQTNKNLNQQHKKEEKELSFSDVLKSVNEIISAK